MPKTTEKLTRPVAGLTYYLHRMAITELENIRSNPTYEGRVRCSASRLFSFSTATIIVCRYGPSSSNCLPTLLAMITFQKPGSQPPANEPAARIPPSRIYIQQNTHQWPYYVTQSRWRRPDGYCIMIIYPLWNKLSGIRMNLMHLLGMMQSKSHYRRGLRPPSQKPSSICRYDAARILGRIEQTHDEVN